MTVYVVAIPWDSASVKSVRVFKKRKDANIYADAVNASETTGYVDNISVDECEVE